MGQHGFAKFSSLILTFPYLTLFDQFWTDDKKMKDVTYQCSLLPVPFPRYKTRKREHANGQLPLGEAAARGFIGAGHPMEPNYRQYPDSFCRTEVLSVHISPQDV